MKGSFAPRIALFGNRNSSQVEALRDVLLDEGAIPLIFNIQLGGEEEPPAITMGNGQASWAGVDFADIAAIHIRCTAPNTLPAVPPVMNAAAYAEWRSPYLREQEYQAVAFSFFDYLHALGKLVINPLTAGYLDHDSKGQLYEKWLANGFPAPHSLTTSDPEEARNFLAAYGDVVVKPAVGVGSTRAVRTEDLARFAEIRRAPVLMQQQIHGSTLRIHIVGDRVVLALRIISDGGVDSRTETRRFEYIRLPAEEEERIVRANRFMGLHYAAWDIIENPAGEYFYLDCNPGPFVMWIGPEFVRVLFRQLARYMITFARTGSIRQASEQVEPWSPS